MAFAAALPSIIGAVGSIGGSVAGGLLGRSGGVDLGAQQQFSMQQLQMQEQFQREMAQNSIQWRVNDAKAAGISPLAALGAPTFSPTVSAPGIDYDASLPRSNGLGDSLGRAGANLGDAIGKSLTAQDKSALLYDQTIKQQQIKSNDMDIAIKGAQLARLNKLLQTPSAPSLTGDQSGLVKIVPDKVVSSRVGDLSTTAGEHPSAQTEHGPESSYATPTSPAVINNPGITNPFLWQWAYNRYGAPVIHGYERWFDRNVTNPIRSVLGMPEYVR